MTQYQFDTEQDWFSHNIPVWEQFIKPLDGKPIHVLEIGSHEGRSSMWIADNILSHPKSTLECIDFWGDTKPWNHKAAEKRFDHNHQACTRSKQIYKHRSKSFPMLVKINAGGKVANFYDFIYIDGNHEAKAVIEDFALCFPLLKPGGILSFDDYTWTHERHFRCPKPAIDCILELWAPDFEVLHVNYQVIIQKNERLAN